MTSLTVLKAVMLTHVRYQRGDRVGHFLAWISLVPVFISLGGFVSHFIFRRELGMMESNSNAFFRKSRVGDSGVFSE